MNKTDQVVHSIASTLAKRGAAAGERMPSLRQISAEHGVSPFVARSAVNALARRGIVEKRWGDGVYVKAVPKGKLRRIVDEYAQRRAAAARRRRSVEVRGRRLDLVSLVIGHKRPDFYGGYFKGAEQTLRGAGFRCLVSCHGGSVSMEEDEVRYMLEAEAVHGFIVAPPVLTEPPPYLVDARRKRVPCVFVGDTVFGDEVAYDSVACDNEAGMLEVTSHLVAHGHRNIWYVGNPSPTRPANRERYAGYRRGMEEAGLEPVREFTFGDRSWSDAERVGELAQALEEAGGPPSAIACFNDTRALQCIRALGALGLRVPDDVSVVGFDDRENVDQMLPALTSVHYPRERIGARAAEIVLAKARGEMALDDWRHERVRGAFKDRETVRDLNRGARKRRKR